MTSCNVLYSKFFGNTQETIFTVGCGEMYRVCGRQPRQWHRHFSRKTNHCIIDVVKYGGWFD